MFLLSSFKSDALASQISPQDLPGTSPRIPLTGRWRALYQGVKNKMIRWYLDIVIIIGLLLSYFWLVFIEIAESFAL